MINVEAVVADIPHFDTFCSVAKLHKLIQSLDGNANFEVEVAGSSVAGVPIHHVRYGKGSVKALFVGFPHCKEPVCGLTVYSLLSLLSRGHPELAQADVEWHIVPCIDPDGALLNEAWTQQPVTMESYMRGFYVQAPQDQVDTSFPIRHKKYLWEHPSKEAQILKGIIDRVLPDYYFSLHNAWTGGVFYMLSHDIDHKYHRALHDFLRAQSFPIQKQPIWKEVCVQFGIGISETWSLRKHYDHLERTTAAPEKALRNFGATSWDYLEEIKPSALTFIAEMGYALHPDDESQEGVEGDLRHFKLRVDADSKYLGTVLLEEWERVKDEVDDSNPLYRAIIGGGVLPTKDSLNEGGRPLSLHPTRDVLFNPLHNRRMTKADRFQACIVDGGFWGLCHTYQFVRLLKASRQTTAVRQATERLENAFSNALAEIQRHVDFDAFRVTDCDTLARVQLGSGLVVLNSLLENRRA